MTDLDAQVERVLAHAAAHRRRRESKDVRADNKMAEALSKAYARAERIHRRQHEQYIVRTFEC